MKKKVVGIGGIFFKSEKPSDLKNWYKEKLDFDTDEYGTMFKSRDIENPKSVNHIQWSPFDNDTDYFSPSSKEFMINYRVNNIEEIVKELKDNGVEVLDEIATYDYGKFVHILDPENNKIELWEPVDEAFEK